MLYAIDALDVLFFRDARPFEQGVSHQARSIFPPLPFTLQGMIRYSLISSELERLGRSFGDYKNPKADDPMLSELTEIRSRLGTGADDFGHLRLRGPFLHSTGQQRAEHNGAWFPMPLDLIQVEESEEKQSLLVMQPAKDQRVAWEGISNRVGNSTERLWPLSLGKVTGSAEPPSSPWLSASDLVKTLTGEDLNGLDPARWPTLYDQELRVGIEKDTTGVAKAGMLYSAQVVRPRPGVSLLFDLSYDGEMAVDLHNALVRLGGDGHLATVRRLTDSDSIAEAYASLNAERQVQDLKKAVREREGRFKLYLASPAVFARGWLPDGIDEADFTATIDRFQCRLVAAAVKKPQYVGGWDLKKGQPKPLLAAVPAGCVYFFEPERPLTDADLDEFIDQLFRKYHVQPFQPARDGAEDGRLWTAREHLGQIGFGLTLVGSWNYV